MNKLLQRFLGALRDRIVASLASAVGSTFSTFRVAQQAEQQSFLEDLARQYESEGKTDLAGRLRAQAAELDMDDPTTEAGSVFQNVLEDRQDLTALGDPAGGSKTIADSKSSGRASGKPRRRKPKQRRADANISLD